MYVKVKVIRKKSAKVCKGILNVSDFALHQWTSVVELTYVERSVQKSEDKQSFNYILRFKEDRFQTELVVI